MLVYTGIGDSGHIFTENHLHVSNTSMTVFPHSCAKNNHGKFFLPKVSTYIFLLILTHIALEEQDMNYL